jgi:hypothetical protein
MNPGPFEAVGQETDEPAAPPHLATEMLTIALTALSQRALTAVASLFSVALSASCFVLFYITLPQPSVQQLIGLGMYSLFILAVLGIRYRGGR